MVTRVPKKPLVLPADMQDDVLQQEGVGRRLAAHRVLKWFYGINRKPEGSLDTVIQLYQNRYTIFCITDACAETKPGKMIVHQSEGFQARFDLTEPTPLLKVNKSFGAFWADMVSHALKGISPPIPIQMRHRDQQYRPYTLHVNRCMRNRFLILIFEEDLQLPSHLEHEKRFVLNSSDNQVQKVNLAFNILKWYLFLSSNAGHQREALKEVVEEMKGCDMFVVADMHAPTATDCLKYMSPLWRYRLGDLKYLIEHVHRPAEYSSKSFRLWNLIVRPLYNGRPVAIQRKITCRDGVDRWYEVSVSFSSQGRRYVVGTFKPIESPALAEEEIEFGCYDFRPHIYATVRNLEWQPSLNSANEDHLKTIKEWMQERKGKEGEKRIFSIIDKCFSDIYEAYVYRSPHAARRYGDVLTTFERIESRTMVSLSAIMTGYVEAAKTLLRTMKRVVTTSSATTSGNEALENESTIRVLTIDETEVDTIRATTLWCPLFDRRYVVVCWDVVETMSYVKTGANTGRVKKLLA